MSENSGSRRSVGRLRVQRGLAAARLAARGGARFAASAPRIFTAAGEQRQKLRNDLALQTAEDVAATLGTMKGVLMKLGQMASYVDDGLNPAVRRTLGRLQDSVPPMTPELAAGVIRDELGGHPETIFAEWDPEPIAAASIGQVHRAMTRDGQAVAVKVQYPGIAETISADLNNVALLRSLLKAAAPGQDVTGLIEELRERVGEELDYEREAASQAKFAAFYDGHPTIYVPKIIDSLSGKRVITSELATGARFSEMLTWSQEEKDLAAETIYRYVFRSVYELNAFNGDPHPGNYLFEPGGRVTFLDYGLVKHFTATELEPLEAMVRTLCLDDDPEAFRQAMTGAGFLAPNAPVSTDEVVDQMGVFYETVRHRAGPRTMTPEYATSVTRKFFDFKSPIAPYASIPPSYVVIQRINLGLFSVLAEMNATGDWRLLAEEIWPFYQGPPSTPMGEAEAAWKKDRGLPVTGAGLAGGAGRRQALLLRLLPFLDGLRQGLQVGPQVGAADLAERAQVGQFGVGIARCRTGPVRGGPAGRGAVRGGLGAGVRLVEDHAGPHLRLAQDLVVAQVRVLGQLAAVGLRVRDVPVGGALGHRQHVDRLHLCLVGGGARPGLRRGPPAAEYPFAQPHHLRLQGRPLGQRPGQLVGDPLAESPHLRLVHAAPPQPDDREGGLAYLLRRYRVLRVRVAREVGRLAHSQLHPKSS